MKDITIELRKFIKSKGYTQESLANELGVATPRVNALLTGKKAFGKKTAEEWGNRFGLNKAWLLTGEGDMLVTQSGTGNISIGHHSINGDNNNNTGDALEVILRLTKMLEQERAEVGRLKAELAELKK